jgi:threonine dehydrogenase-like Zn-dependent dehydrogenase
MKAAYLFNNEIKVGEVSDPKPAKGQVLVRTCSCGLCASDVHFLHSGPKMVSRSQEFGGPYANVDLSKPFVPGHEFVGEILDYGPGSARRLKVGTRVSGSRAKVMSLSSSAVVLSDSALLPDSN